MSHASPGVGALGVAEHAVCAHCVWQALAPQKQSWKNVSICCAAAAFLAAQQSKHAFASAVVLQSAGGGVVLSGGAVLDGGAVLAGGFDVLAGALEPELLLLDGSLGSGAVVWIPKSPR